jgi:hypothetical protein
VRQMEFRRVRRRWPGVTSQLLYMTCRAFMRRNADLPGFRYTSSCPSCLMCALLMDVRHPSTTVILRRERERASKDARPDSPRSSPLRGPRFARAPQDDGQHERCATTIWHISYPYSLHSLHLPITSRFRAAFGARIVPFPCADPERGGGGAPQGAHWVFDHAGEARCRVNGTRRSRCDRDRAPRRSTVAISGRGTTLQLRQCPPDPRCDLPAGPIARPGRLGPVPPAPRFASVGHGTPRPAPSVGSSPETPLMSENESGVA